jgi:hypothetical protein
MSAEVRYSKPLTYGRGELIRSIDEPIRLGSMLWVFTDPHRGHEFAYNRWYERDHYYAGCMIGRYTLAGSRWVAPAHLKELRLPAEGAAMPFDRLDGSYACVYFVLDGHHDEWDAWAAPAMHELYAQDRGFASRTHYNTGFYKPSWRSHRDADPVPLELALDHRYAGMVAVFIDTEDDAALDAWFAEHLPDWLDGSAVATVAMFDSVPLSDQKPDFIDADPRAANRRLQIHFVEQDPGDCWHVFEDLAAALASSGVGTVALAAPFVPTVVGTDRYIDQLWVTKS